MRKEHVRDFGVLLSRLSHALETHVLQYEILETHKKSRTRGPLYGRPPGVHA